MFDKRGYLRAERETAGPRKPGPITERQRDVLLAAMRLSVETGSFPTIRAPMEATGIASLRGVTVHLGALERKGHLTEEGARDGAYRVVKDEEERTVRLAYVVEEEPEG